MSTLFYVRYDTCPKCGRSADTDFIGKSSVGWKFLFAPLPRANGEGIYTWEGWRNYLIDKTIVSEYNVEYSLQDFIDLVESKQLSSNYDAENAPFSVYGPVPIDERPKFERKDAAGYRFATCENFC